MKLSEVFYSIQGEGETAGKARLFIRTLGCNLTCKYCDTKYALKPTGEEKEEEHFYDLLSTHKQWAISGGEPLLQQEELRKLIFKYKPNWVEIETNGTRPIIVSDLIDIVDLWNISPKSPLDMATAVDPSPILLENHKNLLDFIIKFPFTPTTYEQEVGFQIYIQDIFAKYNLPTAMKDRVWIMPITDGDTFKCAQHAWNFAIKHGYNYSDRLHVRVWGAKKGV